MNNTYKAIKIADVENASGETLKISFEKAFDEIKSEAPIRANFEIKSLGEFIEVTGSVNGEVILVCDLCLNEFKYKLDFEIEELFAKKTVIEEYPQDIELKEGQFITDLNGSEDIDIYDLLYQSVILDFPNKKVCGINCKGGDIFIRDENSPQAEIDPRMSVFKDIKLANSDNKTN